MKFRKKKRGKNDNADPRAQDQIPTSNLSKQNFINSWLNGLL